ncbi:MAG TPA: histidine triad nucleotide-binding protein [Gemmatimonadales bacterium]|nr:histidine triad nucleotide-binding protein [Gemmatimonadales bacterium]
MADCIFCRIASGEIPADVVARTPEAVAFRDLNPQAPVHVLVVPAAHHAAARDPRGPEGERLLGHLLAFAAETATGLGLDARGYRIVTNTGKDGGQSVDHLHLHILGGRAMGWPPG